VSVASHKKKHHHNKHFFEMLLKDFQDHPKDEGAFTKTCSKIVGDLLPELREEYTERQVPHVLRDSCEVMKIKEDFRRDEHKDEVSQPVLSRAQVQCKYFATGLSDEYAGKKNYNSWCKGVFKYLTKVPISKKEVAKRLNERNIARANLQKVQDEWEAFRDLKGKAWAQRNKFKRHLEPWANQDFGTYDGSYDKAQKEEKAPKDAKDEEGVDGEADSEEDSEQPTNATGPDGEWRKCCPKGCKVCSGFKLKDKVVRAQLAVSSSSETKTVHMAKMESSEEAEDSEAESDEEEESDEDEADDAEEDSEEDSEEEAEEESEDDEEDAEEAEEDEDDDSEEEDEEEAVATSLIQRRLRHGPKSKAKNAAKNRKVKPVKAKSTKKKEEPKKKQEPIHLSGGFYYLITKEFKRLPKTQEFLDRCVKVIDKLMPDLHEEYTWKQVPFVLKHDCEVYATKTDFKTDRMKLEHAGKTCQFFAKRLADRFRGDKDYKEWCSNVASPTNRRSS
jgi:hypothetical protein